jgi:hypothetical protein
MYIYDNWVYKVKSFLPVLKLSAMATTRRGEWRYSSVLS